MDKYPAADQPVKAIPEWAVRMADHFETNKADPTKLVTAGRRRKRAMKIVPQETFCGRLRKDLLVRKEYPVVWDRIVADFSEPGVEDGGLCLYGQPGSGKSMSLFYLLMRALMAGWDVAFINYQGEEALLFSGGKVSEQRLDYFDLRGTSEPKLLVLHDVDGPAPISPDVYDVANPPYVVLASSPQYAVYHSWAKACGPQFACFRPFRWSEVALLLAAYPEQYEKEKDYWDLKTTFRHLGPSLRTALQAEVPRTGSDPRQDFEIATEELAIMVRSVETLQVLLRKDRMGFDDPLKQSPGYHELFALKPDRTLKDPGFFWMNPRCEVVFANSFLRMVFFRNLKHANFMQRRKWITVWNLSTSACGAMLELYSVRWLSWSPRPTEISTVDGCQYPALPATLPTALDPLSLEERPQEKVLHVAPFGATTIDALYEDGKKRLYLFQITLAHQHGVNEVGLSQALRAYKNVKLKEVLLVFVVQKEKRGRALASAVGRKEGMNLKVGRKHYQVKFGYLIIGHDLLLTLEEKIAAARKLAPNGYILSDSATSCSSQANSSFAWVSFDTSLQIADEDTMPKFHPNHRTAAVLAPALSRKSQSQNTPRQYNGSSNQEKSRKRRNEAGADEDGLVRSSQRKKVKITIKEYHPKLRQ